MGYKSPTIKLKILYSYTLLLILPLSIVTIFTYIQSSKMMEKQAVKQFTAVSGVTNQQFDQYFRDIENSSVNILSDQLIQRVLNQPYYPPKEWTLEQIDQENAVYRYLSTIYRLNPGISSLIIYGINGMNYFYHPTLQWDSTVDGREDPLYARAMSSGGKWILSGKRQDLQLSNALETEPEEVVTFARSIRDLDSRKPLGALYINVKLDVLKSFATLKDEDSRVVILDEAGHEVFSFPEGEGIRSDGEIMEVSSKAPFTGWSSVYSTSKKTLLKESKQIRNFIIIVTAISFLLALMLATLISSGIVRPLAELKKKMKKLERGEFESLDMPRAQDEVGELTHGYNLMVRRLRQSLEETRNQENLRMETELNAMQARINPHFMYNTLNGIRWVAMMEGNERVTDMITSFVYLLQFSAQNKEQLISVRRELEVLDHYVKLMKMRNDQFEFTVEVADPALYDCCIIPFLLQPIVENAIFHGIIPLKAPGRIEARIDREEAFVTTLVRDNGVGMDEAAMSALFARNSAGGGRGSFSRIGLNNVRDRLKLQFGSQAELTVVSKRGAGTEIRIQWPIRLCVKEADDHV